MYRQDNELRVRRARIPAVPADDAPVFNPPDAETIYANYCETFRRLGVEPLPRERARDQMQEWSDALAGCWTSGGPACSHGESHLFGIYHYAACTACHEHPE